MKKTLALCLVVLGIALLASPAAAQTKPPNPTGITFTASADHAQIAKYTIGYFLPGATAPVQTADLGKPVPDATNTCTATINVQPVAFGVDYVAKLKAVTATGVESEWSDPSNPFDRIPGKPGAGTVKK